ncbi:LacI family DNA-binding transcriptional regulator [Flectobacillus major]|uniref:LacI family DNA-binding transcriptional regulator n=1 Tax=Flectobacillus major TaxID=103 RepID=UPI000401BC69|nr:substrate-binding domain-containing protein [Flectobacillus major]
MSQCIKCGATETLVKAGFVRGQQRFYCKACEQYFTIQLPHQTIQKKSHQTTIVDIAKALGVAPSTVSRALNNSKEINEATRQEIIRVAQELDYRPNLLAQSLNRGATNTIGVVIPDIQRPFFASVLAGIQHVASNAGYRVMICQSNESHSTETLNVQALISSQVDGLLISHSIETTSFEHIKLHLNRGVPIVHFDRVCYELPTAKVILDNFRGSYLLVEHLILQGCKRIAICAGPKDLLISKERFEGYVAALAAYHIPFDEALVYHIHFQKDESLVALNQWMALPEPPDAIFSVHHGNAIELLVALKERNVRIPEDIALVGFGDDQIAALIEPSLTVFHQFPFKVGEIAANTLINNIIEKDNFTPTTITVQGELIVRKSSQF